MPVPVKSGRLDAEIALDASTANGMYLMSVQTSGGNRVFHLVLER